MDIDRIIKDANAVKPKEPLVAVSEVISTLRDKGYSWRDIASFLTDRGVKTDHTKVYRYFQKTQTSKGKIMKFITKQEYLSAFDEVCVSDKQKKALIDHYNALNRSIAFTDLGNSSGHEDHRGMNSLYGKLGKKIGIAAGFKFADYDKIPGKPLHLSALGFWNPYSEGNELVMYHELAKAIEEHGMLGETASE